MQTVKLPLIAATTSIALLFSSVAAAQSSGVSALVQQRTVSDVYAADAVIEAVRLATVSAQISGTVTQLLVDAGDRVRKGQLLVRIDTRETDAQVATQRANVAQAEAALTNAKLNFDRTQSLLQQKFVSQSALDKAEADLKAAQAALEATQAGVTQATTARSFAEVRSPLDGVVSRRLTELGELATPGKPLLEIHDPTTLRATGAVPQFVLARIKQVAKATVVLPSVNQTVESTHVTLLPASDPRLLSTQVRADLPAGLPRGVVPGITAKILLPTGDASKLVMPAAAVVRRGEMTAVYVLGADNKPQLRQVRVGELTDGGQIEVLSGVAAGDRVQLNPLAK
jgi:RND family efflux transporter MFP subunit